MDNYLKIWLLFVASLRALSVVLGYLDKIYFQERVFPIATEEGTPLLPSLPSNFDSHWSAGENVLCMDSSHLFLLPHVRHQHQVSPDVHHDLLFVLGRSRLLCPGVFRLQNGCLCKSAPDSLHCRYEPVDLPPNAQVPRSFG